ncbi:MAG: hypothetical protein EBU81_12955 [Proteobacteria bacterium]|jgi:hypothetical protein|nr:hypothetical protein [Pseudomonadota bacterium]
MSDDSPSQINKYLHMGLGEAVRRLLDVEIQYRHGQRGEALVRERDLILSALNRVELQLGFDCNSDGVPDTVEIFQQAAETSCCRITSFDTPPSPKQEPLIVLDTSRASDADPGKKVETVSESEGLFSRLFGRKK